MKNTTYKGVYKIYLRHFHGIPDQLIGRVQCGKTFEILEDHKGIFDYIAPEGEMTDLHHKIMDSLSHSGYFRVISEEHLNQGLVEDVIPELDLNMTPDHEYMLVSGDMAPVRLHIFDSHWVVNGRKITDEEKAKYIALIRSKKLEMHPL